MAEMMQFDLVSPERRLASYEAREVQLPGAEGDMTAMPDHAPIITTLRPGVIKVVTAQGTESFVVTGGFAEITGQGVTVLAERAMAPSEMTQEVFDTHHAEAVEAHKAAGAELVDDAAKLLSDLVAMGSEIGLSARQG